MVKYIIKINPKTAIKLKLKGVGYPQFKNEHISKKQTQSHKKLLFIVAYY